MVAKTKSDRITTALLMFSGQSLLAIAAAWLYAVVLLACLAACLTAFSRKQPTTQSAQWAVLAILFLGLFALRAFGVEESLRQSLRADLMVSGEYEKRRDFQRPVAAAVIVAGAALVGWQVYRIAQAGRRRRVLALSTAMLAGTGMIGLLSLRIISLHQIDALLYGPLKLNWLGDIGASLWVMGAALYYAWVVMARPR